ncbi:MAG: hypothetical protein OEZ08_17255 [Betaproteobacteria bacterium]|nr:hypothetical protein [Betaproteobacteria bacterium]
MAVIIVTASRPNRGRADLGFAIAAVQRADRVSGQAVDSRLVQPEVALHTAAEPRLESDRFPRDGRHFAYFPGWRVR